MLKRLALALAGAFLCASSVLAADYSTVQASLSGLNLLETHALDTSLDGHWFVQNQSANTIVVVLCASVDAVTPCARPGGTFLVGSGGSANSQGGSVGWQDTAIWRGRIDVYGPAGSQHTFVAR